MAAAIRVINSMQATTAALGLPVCQQKGAADDFNN
jgi:hypothetical protein